MKLTVKTSEIKKNVMVFCCDVGKDEISVFAESHVNGKTVEVTDKFRNRTVDIEQKLEEYQKFASEHGGLGVLVICEPTGGYETRFMKMARTRGCRTSYISGEATSKLRMLATNDPEKSDEKDPRVIHSAQKAGKTLHHRVLPDIYEEMRLHHQFIEDENDAIVVLRNQIAHVVKQLFPDFPLPNTYLFTNGGKALIDVYGCDPSLIAVHDWHRLVREIRKHSRLQEKTILKIYEAAVASSMHIIGTGQKQALVNRLRILHSQWRVREELKEEYKQKLISLYQRTPEYKKLGQIESVSDYLMAKVLAECGPLNDFKDISQLMRYAGLNLCRKSSGKYKGHTKISKKGRSLLRKALYQVAFSCLIKNGQLYGGYYEKTKQRLNFANKAIVSVMRKFLKLIYGVNRSVMAFDPNRVMRCKSDYETQKAA